MYDEKVHTSQKVPLRLDPAKRMRSHLVEEDRGDVDVIVSATSAWK